jgi:hypothetical protein
MMDGSRRASSGALRGFLCSLISHHLLCFGWLQSSAHSVSLGRPLRCTGWVTDGLLTGVLGSSAPLHRLGNGWFAHQGDRYTHHLLCLIYIAKLTWTGSTCACFACVVFCCAGRIAYGLLMKEQPALVP